MIRLTSSFCFGSPNGTRTRVFGVVTLIPSSPTKPSALPSSFQNKGKSKGIPAPLTIATMGTLRLLPPRCSNA